MTVPSMSSCPIPQEEFVQPYGNVPVWPGVKLIITLSPGATLTALRPSAAIPLNV
ncbi:MAG: hypothetical protein LC796_14970 [Acidobacteria bacterium]|nr:hypothetical protein [Acidobacteriota bacterium]